MDGITLLNRIVFDIKDVIKLIPFAIFSAIIVFIVFYMIKGELPGIRGRKIGTFLLLVYIIVTITFTYFTREPGKKVINLIFLGTIINKHSYIYIIENILMFVPLGILFPYVFKIKRNSISICAFFLFSLFIETTQLISRRGYFEVDDIWTNILGGSVGLIIYKLISLIMKGD